MSVSYHAKNLQSYLNTEHSKIDSMAEDPGWRFKMEPSVKTLIEDLKDVIANRRDIWQKLLTEHLQFI